jgi:hypothetical protein
MYVTTKNPWIEKKYQILVRQNKYRIRSPLVYSKSMNYEAHLTGVDKSRAPGRGGDKNLHGGA